MKKQYVIGLHPVNAVLKKQPERVINLYVQSDRQDEKMQIIFALAKRSGVPITELGRKELDNLANSSHHQGVVAICSQQHVYSEHDLKHILQHTQTSPLVLILDGVQDPHNLGACFRSADAAGVHAIVAPKDKSVGITPVVTKVASGAVASVPFVQVTNLVRAIEELKSLNVWVFGADAESPQTVYQTNLTGPTAIVLGAEGKGLRRLTREHCDALIKIPMYGSVSSLNVSVAAGIFLFEIVRQRQIPPRKERATPFYKGGE